MSNLSRKSLLAVVVLALSVLALVRWGNWSLRGEQDTVQTVQMPALSAPALPKAMAPALPTSAQHSSAAAEAGQAIRVSNGLLSVSVRNQSLGRVLKEIERQSGIAFHVSGEIAAHRFSLTLREVPLDKALAQLLSDFDSVHYFGAQNSSARGLQAVWIYPQGQGLASARDHERASAGPRSGADPAYRSPVQQAADADPAIRAQALSALAEGSEPGVDPATARAALQAALADPDPQVRAQALNGLVSADRDAAFAYQLQGLRDADPAVRLMAVGTLEAQGQGMALLQAALNDPDEEVRLAARLQLERNRPK